MVRENLMRTSTPQSQPKPGLYSAFTQAPRAVGEGVRQMWDSRLNNQNASTYQDLASTYLNLGIKANRSGNKAQAQKYFQLSNKQTARSKELMDQNSSLLSDENRNKLVSGVAQTGLMAGGAIASPMSAIGAMGAGGVIGGGLNKLQGKDVMEGAGQGMASGLQYNIFSPVVNPLTTKLVGQAATPLARMGVASAVGGVVSPLENEAIARLQGRTPTWKERGVSALVGAGAGFVGQGVAEGFKSLKARHDQVIDDANAPFVNGPKVVSNPEKVPISQKDVLDYLRGPRQGGRTAKQIAVDNGLSGDPTVFGDYETRLAHQAGELTKQGGPIQRVGGNIRHETLTGARLADDVETKFVPNTFFSEKTLVDKGKMTLGEIQAFNQRANGLNALADLDEAINSGDNKQAWRAIRVIERAPKDSPLAQYKNVAQGFKEKLPPPPNGFFDPLEDVGGQKVVYRATDSKTGKSVLGEGTYFTSDPQNAGRWGKNVEKYVVSPNAKMADLQDPSALQSFTDDAISANRDLYNKLIKSKGEQGALGEVLTKYAKEQGFDGIMGDDKAFGSVVFNKALLQSADDSQAGFIDPLADVGKKKPQLDDVFTPEQPLGPQGEPKTAVDKVIRALKEAKPLRGEQEKLYSAERSARAGRVAGVGANVPGEKGFHAQLGQLKGELPKVEFEGIRTKLTQTDVDDLFNQVEGANMSPFEKVTAKTGLAKLLGQEGGSVPNRSELKLLNEVFPPEFVSTALEKRPMMQKLMEAGGNVLNLPRSVMATADLSAPLRQGAFLIGRPKQWVPAFLNMFKYALSDDAYQGLQDDIQTRPTYQAMRENRLAITDMSSNLDAREEAFMSNIAERIPGFGTIAKGSNRAYSGFLNKLRADTFDDLYNTAQAQGLIDDNPKIVADIAKFVNSATGRGDLGALSKASVVLNGAFFSPRLIASRMNLLNPAYYATLDPFVRKEALKSLLTFAATGASIATLAKLGGADVGTDPRSADFGKIKVGNTRFDPWGGFQQYIVLASRLLSGQMVSSTTGKEFNLGEGYRPTTRLDILQRFFESKNSPIASFIIGMLKGQTTVGEKFNPSVEVVDRFIPMVVQDVYDLQKEWGPKGLLMGIPALFGTGVQTYSDQVPMVGKTATGKPNIQWRMEPGLGETLLNKATGTEVSNIPKDQWGPIQKQRNVDTLEKIEVDKGKATVLETGEPMQVGDTYIFLQNGIVKTVRTKPKVKVPVPGVEEDNKQSGLMVPQAYASDEMDAKPVEIDPNVVRARISARDPSLEGGELASYYLRDVGKMGTSEYQNRINENKLYQRLSDVQNSESLTDEQRTDTIALMLKQTGISPDEYKYHSVAKQGNELKTLYANEEITKLISSGSTPKQVYDWLIDNLREVNGDKVLTDGVLSSLVAENLISKEDADLLKKVKVEGSGVNRKIVVPKTKLKVKKIKTPKLKKIKIPKPKKPKTIKPLKFKAVSIKLR